MSSKFIRIFKSNNKCLNCPPGKSFCSLHNLKAKLMWRVRSANAKLNNTCFNCNEKPYKNTGRCLFHRNINQKSSKKFQANNPKRDKTYIFQRKEHFRNLGLCWKCPSHSPLADGCTNCRSCRDKHRLFQSDKTLFNKIKKNEKKSKIKNIILKGRQAAKDLLKL